MKYTMSAVLFASFMIIGSAIGKEIVIGKAPIPVVMQPGHEIRVEFPETIINLNIDAEADNALETLLKPDGTLLWKATRNFANSRALATTAKGDLIVLDIKTGQTNEKVYQLVRKKTEATATVPTEPERVPNKDPYVLMPDFLRQSYETGSKKVDANNRVLPQAEQEKRKPASYTDMAAFAMQHYIGPTRLITDLPAQRVKHKLTSAKLNRLIRVWQNRLRLRPLDVWVLDKHYITAIKVKNISAQPYHFDPRAIRGRFQFVASLRDVLPPLGSANNETVWVFITSAPLEKSLLTLR